MIRFTLLVSLAAPLIALLSASAQEGYRLPPPEVVEIVDAAPTPGVSFSPDGRWRIVSYRDAAPSIADISRRMLRLAGTRIDPAANGPYQTSFTRRLVLEDLHGERVVELGGEEGGEPARIGTVSWSPDSQGFAFTKVTAEGTSLYVAHVSGSVRPVTTRLSSVLGGFSWAADGSALLCQLVPEDRGAEPVDSGVPTGPNIQATTGERSPTRTYQDLLSSEHDSALFEHYARAELVLISAFADGERKSFGTGLFLQASLSPDGKWLLEARLERLFSYLMPYYQFPHTFTARGIDGDAKQVICRVPLAQNIPIGGVRTGPRSVGWKASEPASLVWVEALDGGDPERKVEHRDQWSIQAAPFDKSPTRLALVEHRAQGLRFFADPALFLTSEYDRDTRWTRTILHGAGEPKVLEDRSQRDRYADPGRIATLPGPFGRRVVRSDGPWIYRSGRGASPEGLLPFLDRQNLETLETERLWRCEKGSYESVAQILATGVDRRPRIITSYQSKQVPPNYRLRDLTGDDVVALTDFPDPTPQLRGITKELVTYERADGVPLSATLYLPAGYEPGTRLPLLVWAYPIEFNDPRTAGQVSTTADRFTRVAGLSHLILLTQGYAIMDGATMPVIGDPETMNDTFREQIVDAARAAIDEAVRRGVADPDRVAVGGHSYGAFMTANLLAHCDLFRAGVARSGAYNRTLTPFGFQSERRPFWDAPETYFAVSPFMHADKINEPILLIHGEVDNNSGTFPQQSRRLFQAIKGLGGTARLVMLPNESHGYRARESVLHVQAETIAWLDEHVKNPKLIEAAFTSDENK